VRIPSPGPLRIDRQDLLRDARARLLEHLPDLQGATIDPTDPGWLLLEQAAWMVEQLSERLDDYPLAVLQQLLHLFGGQMQAAVPALGLVALRPQDAGVIRTSAAQPAPIRFFAPQNEVRDQIEFVPVEPATPVRPVGLVRLWDWDGHSLFQAGSGDAEVTTSAPERADQFHGETIAFDIVGVEGDEVASHLKGAVEKLQAGNVGWLKLDVTASAGGSRATLRAWVDPAAAFAESSPGGLTDGEVLRGKWASLDDSTWTPSVAVSHHPSVPRRLHGMHLEPGRHDGVVLLHHVPPGIGLAELFERPAAPLPARLAEDIWLTLGRIEPRLTRLRPRIRRQLSEASAREVPWLASVVRSARWGTLTRGGPCTLLELQLTAERHGPPLRIALLTEPGAAPTAEVWTLQPDGTLGAAPTPLTPLWSMRMPGENGPVAVHVVELREAIGARALLLRTVCGTSGVLTNPMLVVNAPVIRDGRTITIRRAVPEPYALLEEDIVGPSELQRLQRRPFGTPVAGLLQQLPLSVFQVAEEDDIHAFSGVMLDARRGELRTNAPDSGGRLRDLAPGAEVTLAWYRRTDGEWGNVSTGAIRFVEQAPSARPRIRSASNPLPMVGGQDRESEKEARVRLFAPGGRSLSLPSDWERELRSLLGEGDWRVRVWTHTERALVEVAFWNPAEAPTRAIRAALDTAGPHTLLIAVGRSDRRPTPEELARATVLAEQLCTEARHRASPIRAVQVAALTPVWLEGTADEVLFPTHDTHGLEGTLLDDEGRKVPVPMDVLLLDAVVVGTRVRGAS
jgi:hypothetical protein